MPFDMNATKKISVLCATRGRPAMIMESMKSMLDTADNPDGIEFLLAIDDDDQLTMYKVILFLILKSMTMISMHLCSQDWAMLDLTNITTS